MINDRVHLKNMYKNVKTFERNTAIIHLTKSGHKKKKKTGVAKERNY